MSHPIYGNAPPEVIAKFEAARAVEIEVDRKRIAAGDYGDVPQKLTEEDERILDQAWRELAEEEAAAERIAA